MAYYAGSPVSGIGISYARPSAAPAFSYGSGTPSSSPVIGMNGAYGGAGHAPEAKMYAHSGIEAMLEAAMNIPHKSEERPRAVHYVPSSARGSYLINHTPHEYFSADTFLKPGSTSRFVGDAAEIKDDIEAAFKATTGDELPKDIIITVLNDKEFSKAQLAHEGNVHENVLGFSLNSNGRSINQVFVRANPLDKLMLTIGHEIGHVLTQTLADAHDEEAKAFAFSIAWMDSIRENNIAGIGSHIMPNPAENGLHDRAFAFVQWLIDRGTRAWEAFLQLARGEITVSRQPITVEV